MVTIEGDCEHLSPSTRGLKQARSVERTAMQERTLRIRASDYSNPEDITAKIMHQVVAHAAAKDALQGIVFMHASGSGPPVCPSLHKSSSDTNSKALEHGAQGPSNRAIQRDRLFKHRMFIMWNYILIWRCPVCSLACFSLENATGISNYFV